MFGDRTARKRERLRKGANRLLYRIQKLEAQCMRVETELRTSFGPDMNEVKQPGICDHCRLPGTETVQRLAADLADFGGSMISTVNGTEYICFDRDSDEYGDMGLVYYWAYGAPGPDDEEPSFDSDGNIMRCVNESWCAGCLNAFFCARWGWNADRPHSPQTTINPSSSYSTRTSPLSIIRIDDSHA